jgi:hypothetical protein
MQRACAVLSVQYFSTLSRKQQDFRKKRLLNIKCVFWFFLPPSETLHMLRNGRDTIKNINFLYVKCRLFLPDFDKTSILWTDFRKTLKCHENASGGSRVVLCGQTDTTKLIVAFRSFAIAPKNSASSRLRLLALFCLWQNIEIDERL